MGLNRQALKEVGLFLGFIAFILTYVIGAILISVEYGQGWFFVLVGFPILFSVCVIIYKTSDAHNKKENV